MSKNNSRTNYISRVPKYVFSEDKKEQLAQLEANPLLQRFREAHEALASDRHRPLYHYVNPESTLNDPNGLCFWGGNWHLFYQAYPPEDPRQHWGHAISRDLIHWRDLPYAIYPHPEECCYSGTALVEDARVIAIYHGTKIGNMVAVSSDPLLLNWEKLGDGAVIPIPEDDDCEYTIFDPCIWSKDGRYYALSGGTLPKGPANRHVRVNFLFRSDDLVNWEYLHPFIEDDQFTVVGDDGACPYFWPIGANKHMLLFFSHMTGGQYLVGDYDKARDKFVVTDGGLFNFGAAHPSGVHAPSAAPDGDGGIIVIFNMNQGMPTAGWNQIMTLPRRLTLDEDDRVLMEPAGDIESLRGESSSVDDIVLPANQEIVLDGIAGNSMELQLDLETGEATLLELNVLRSPGHEEFTRIAFYRERGNHHKEGLSATRAMNASTMFMKALPTRKMSLISLDTSYSSTLPEAYLRPPETAPVHLAPGETLRLRVFIDRSVVEVFVNGRQCVAARVYPGRDDSLGVSLRAQGKDARLVRLDAWQMKGIWGDDR